MSTITVKNPGVAPEKKICASDEKKEGELYVLKNDLKAFLNLREKPARLRFKLTVRLVLGVRPFHVVCF